MSATVFTFSRGVKGVCECACENGVNVCIRTFVYRHKTPLQTGNPGCLWGGGLSGRVGAGGRQTFPWVLFGTFWNCDLFNDHTARRKMEARSLRETVRGRKVNSPTLQMKWLRPGEARARDRATRPRLTQTVPAGTTA